MKRKFFAGMAAVVLIGFAATASNVFAQAYYSAEDVKTDVQKVEKGLQITVTSDDTEIAKDIQDNHRWYRDAFRHGYGQRPRGCRGGRDDYCGGPCHRGTGGWGYGHGGGWR